MAVRRAGALRLVALVLAGGGVVAAAGTGVTFGTGEAGPRTPAAATSAPDAAAYPAESVLACPGIVEDRAQEMTAETRVRAVGAPMDIFGEAPAPTGTPTLELALVGTDGLDVVAPDDEAYPSALLEDGMWGVARARGGQAPGVVASQLSLVPDTGARGWALTPCSAPADVVHLVGGGEGAGRVELLVVANPSSDPVTVDVEVFGEDGVASTVGGSGLVVPPEGRLVERLDALAPSVRHPVVRVVAQGGPVTAHLADRERSGTTDLGQEMAAAAATPTTELVVPALPHHEQGEQTHTLRLFAPDGAAVVELRALTEHGAHIPDPAVVRVPAGSTVEVEMDDLPDGPGALRLRSDAPVTAGARLQVAPVSDEPIVLEEDAPEGDDAQATSAPDDAQATSGPEDAQATSVPDAPPQAEPVLHPAGESAWVAAVPLSEVPLGIAVPDLSDLPGLTEQAREPVVALAVSAVDGTTATVLRLDDRDRVRTEQLTLANDTTHVLEVPSGTVALWVLPAQDVGVAAALHLSHQDVVGPYLTSASLAQVPWTRAVPPVVPVLP